MRRLTRNELLVLILALSVAPAIFVGAKWKAKGDRKGQARVDHRFKDGDTIRVGSIALTAHITNGGTRGCTSWTFGVRDGERVLNVVSACGFGKVLGMRYPGQDADIERSLRVLRSLPADI